MAFPLESCDIWKILASWLFFIHLLAALWFLSHKHLSFCGSFVFFVYFGQKSLSVINFISIISQNLTILIFSFWNVLFSNSYSHIILYQTYPISSPFQLLPYPTPLSSAALWTTFFLMYWVYLVVAGYALLCVCPLEHGKPGKSSISED